MQKLTGGSHRQAPRGQGKWTDVKRLSTSTLPPWHFTKQVAAAPDWQPDASRRPLPQRCVLLLLAAGTCARRPSSSPPPSRGESNLGGSLGETSVVLSAPSESPGTHRRRSRATAIASAVDPSMTLIQESGHSFLRQSGDALRRGEASTIRRGAPPRGSADGKRLLSSCAVRRGRPRPATASGMATAEHSRGWPGWVDLAGRRGEDNRGSGLVDRRRPRIRTAAAGEVAHRAAQQHGCPGRGGQALSLATGARGGLDAGYGSRRSTSSPRCLPSLAQPLIRFSPFSFISICFNDTRTPHVSSVRQQRPSIGDVTRCHISKIVGPTGQIQHQ